MLSSIGLMQVLHLVALHVLFVALAFYAVLVSAQRRLQESHGPGAALSDLLQGMSARWAGSSMVGAMHACSSMMSQIHVCRQMHVKSSLLPLLLTHAVVVCTWYSLNRSRADSTPSCLHPVVAGAP